MGLTSLATPDEGDEALLAGPGAGCRGWGDEGMASRGRDGVRVYRHPARALRRELRAERRRPSFLLLLRGLRGVAGSVSIFMADPSR